MAEQNTRPEELAAAVRLLNDHLNIIDKLRDAQIYASQGRMSYGSFEIYRLESALSEILEGAE